MRKSLVHTVYEHTFHIAVHYSTLSNCLLFRNVYKRENKLSIDLIYNRSQTNIVILYNDLARER